MKRTLSLLLTALLLLPLLAGCGSAPAAEPVSLYDRGLSLVAMLGEMAGSEDYLRLMATDEEILALLEPVGAGDYSTPRAVYQLTLSEDAAARAFGQPLPALSEAVIRSLTARVPLALLNQLNAQDGASTLAAASLCTASDAFMAAEEETADCVYLYTFDSGVPIAVIFTAAGESTVSATALFLLSGAVTVDSEEAVRASFEPLGFTVLPLAPDAD